MSDDPPSVVSWLTAVAAVLALVWSIVWAIYSSKRLTKEAEERKEADKLEQGQRAEELKLLREQVQVAERAVQREESAGMTAVRLPDGPIPPEWQNRRAYRYGLRNTGRAHASDVDAWLIDQEGREVSDFDDVHSRIAGLAPGESGEVAVVVEDDERARDPLRLKVVWNGLQGPDEYVSNVKVPPDGTGR